MCNQQTSKRVIKNITPQRFYTTSKEIQPTGFIELSRTFPCSNISLVQMNFMKLPNRCILIRLAAIQSHDIL